MKFLPHAHRISLLSPAPVSHIFHSCRPSMPRKQKAALDNIRWEKSYRHSPTRIHDLPDICPCYKIPVHDIPLFFIFSAHPACPRCKACTMLHFPCCHKHLEFFYWNLMKLQYFCRTQWFFSRFSTSDRKKMDLHIRSLLFIIRLRLSLSRVYTRMLNLS